jgi:acylphosphatase
MEARIRRRVWVSGRVQGVAFRAALRREARAAGVTGWARNLADGRVEAVLEGGPDAVAALVAWCRAGPSHARVERVEVQEEAHEGLAGFEVR